MKSVQSKKFIRLLSGFLSLTFLICSVFGADLATFAAASRSELNAQKDKIEQQIEAKEKQLAQLKADKAKQQEYLNALYQKVELLQDKVDTLQKESDSLKSQIATVEQNIKDTEAEIDSIQAEIDKKQAEFDSTYDTYCQRLRAMYVSGHVSNLEVLLTSGDMSSILVRSQMISSVSEQDTEMLDDLIKQMEQIEKDKADLEAKRNQLNEDKTKLEADKKELDANLNEQKKVKAQYDAEVAECNKLIREIDSDTNDIKETIATSQKEIDAINDMLKQTYSSASTGSGTVSGNGKLSYPTSYRTISAGYPNYSNGSYHGGVDWPCPTGTAVRAAGSGTVLSVKYLNYSYGYHIIIDHGDGLSTLYAHNSELLVSAGQQVSKGQLIAKSGSTGNSSGPHVHFEVRVNGTQVNPLKYL